MVAKLTELIHTAGKVLEANLCKVDFLLQCLGGWVGGGGFIQVLIVRRIYSVFL